MASTDRNSTDPLRIVITGAAGQIAYSLIHQICNGDVFGKNQSVILHLLDITPMMGVLQGVVMEIEDTSLPLVKGVVPTDSEETAFKDVDVALFVGAMPRKEGMERKDLLSANVKIFKSQGTALDKFAKKTVKVLVVGNPANTNCYILAHYAQSIPRENFTCLTRLDHNRAKAQIASRLKVSPDAVKNLTIWGNHSSTQFPDVRSATVTINGKETPVYEAVKDDNWLKNDFVSTVQKRGAAVIAARKLSSAMSAAKAICDHVHDWWQGTKDDDWVSMGVISDGSYDIEKGLVFSYPVQIKNGKITIVQGLNLDDWSREMLDKTQKELVEEKNDALKATSSG
jgi:malate dehydrogenase